MVEQKKTYTATEVAEGILARAKELIARELKKSEKDDGLKKADPREQTSAQAAGLHVPQPKPTESQPKAIAKQPLQLAKFMEKSAMKKAAKDVKGVHKPDTLMGHKGISDAGFRARIPSLFQSKKESVEEAKDEHRKVLSELKDMPKPNLPK